MPATATFDPAASPGEPEGISLADMLAIVRRRAALLVVVVALLGALAVAVALLLPAVYRAQATILIQEQEIPQELVRSTITSFADERIQVISQQVMTRATLLSLVERYDLYPKARQRETGEELLDRMRRDIKLTPISADVTDRRSGSPAKATIAFTLSYDSEVPAAAQKVASELTTLFLNENLKNRQQRASETTQFLDSELARIGGQISVLEEQLTELKRSNEGRTPDLSLSNLIGAERAESEIQRIDRELQLLQERKRSLETQLAETRPVAPLAAGAGVLEPEDRLRALQTQLAGQSGVYSDDHPDIRRLRREIAALQAATGLGEVDADRRATLDTLRQQLAALRQKYSDDHPDVVRLRRTYDALVQSVAAGSAAAQAQGALTPRPPDNPVFIALRAQVDSATAQLEALRAERREQATRRDQLAARLAKTPEVEREMLEVVRELDTARARFRELRDKQMQAQVAEQLERSRKAERFTVIEPPVFPEKPQRPNRPVILLMGALVALFGGVLAVALREALDSTVHGPREAVRVLQVPVLALLPATALPQSSRRQRMRWLIGGLAVAGTATVALTLVHWFHVPLDVAWYAVLRKWGP